MINMQPPNLIDGLFSPPPALNNPVQSQPDGGYNWGNRGFPPPTNPGPGQAGHHFVQGGFNPAQPISRFAPDLRRGPVVAAQNPVPGHAPTLAQMRNMMTQLHVQQMLNRMQKHSNYHAGG